MKISEHKMAAFWIVVFLVSVLIGVSCPGCGISSQSESVAESTSDAAATAEVGNTDIATDVSVSGVTIETGGSQPAPETTIADVMLYVLKSWFYRGIGIAIFLAWVTGNLHPAKNLSFRD